MRRRISIGPGRAVLPASLKLMLAGAAGLATAFGSSFLAPRMALPLIGWVGGGTVYLLATWPHILRYKPPLVQEHALREDPSRAAAGVVLLAAALASLAAVAMVQIRAPHAVGAGVAGYSLLALASVLVSWLIVHTVYALRYAELYYSDPPGGIDFGDTRSPTYTDFAYLAFTLGMTFQVSDTAFRSGAFRRTALQHALLSYLFGTVIIAGTVNLIAGMGK